MLAAAISDPHRLILVQFLGPIRLSSPRGKAQLSGTFRGEILRTSQQPTTERTEPLGKHIPESISPADARRGDNAGYAL